MRTWVHILVSSILVLMLFPKFKWTSLIIFIGGILIDVDHYLWYIYKYKNWSLIECYKHYSNQMEIKNYDKNFGILLVFHTIEFLLIIIALSFLNKFALIFTIGLLSHYIFDLIFLYTGPKRFIANHSIVHWIFKNKIQKL